MTEHDPTVAFLQLLAAGQPEGRYLEIRSRTPRGLRQEFFPASHLDVLRERALRLGQRTDTYIGVVPRISRSGKKQAVGESLVIWCEIDSRDAEQRLADARVKPALTVESGTPGHLHAYWRLSQPLGVELLERANAALVAEFGGDPACIDASRILRIPGTLNFKHQPPRPVRLAGYNLRYRPLPVREIVGELPDPEPPAPRPVRFPPSVALSPATLDRLDRTAALKLIPATEWAQALLGVQPGADGKIACPFHGGGQERTPSLQLYSDGHWFCYGCRQGGSVIDFAGRIWNLEPRGQSFNELRDRLWAHLGQQTRTAATVGAAGRTELAPIGRGAHL